LTILLLTILLLPTTISHTQQTNWITLVSIHDETEDTQLTEKDPLLAGHTYNITVKIKIPYTQNTSLFAINLNNNMTRVGLQYWHLLTEDYKGIDPFLYTPSEKTITFIQIEGEILISIIFSIPQNATTKPIEKMTLRTPKTNQEILRINVEGGATVGTLVRDISDSAIENYLDTVEMKSNLIPNGQIDKSFLPLITDIIEKADKLYKLGLPEQATEILETIDPELYPPPPDTTLQTALTAGVILLAIITVAITVTYLRLNTRNRYNLSIIDETRDELANLEVTAERYDDNLANQLKRLREKLSEGE